MKYNFIRTADKETYESLLKEGFKLMSQDNGFYTFLNDEKLSFDNKKLKVTYSNILTF